MTDSPRFASNETLERRVVRCRLCPRLVSYREGVRPRVSFAGQRYWRRPVPGFGDLNGRVLIIGLSPAAHGGNRTGRVFTGDPSGRFLVRALHSTGFASQPNSDSRDDGLVYRDCYVTAAVKCAPPGDRPTPTEFDNCSRYLDAEVAFMKDLRAVLALGALAFRAYLGHLGRHGVDVKGVKFAHGKVFRFAGEPSLYASYHPSPRNTNTGVLTHRMLVGVLGRIRSDLLKA